MEITGMTLEDLWVGAAKTVIEHGERRAPRGLPTREIVGAQLILMDPRDRIPRLPVREFSLAYAMGELAWYVAADDSLEFIKYYAPSYGKYSDNQKSLHGAYGPRVFGKRPCAINEQICDPDDGDHMSQWDMCKEILTNDQDSRQAVISIYSQRDCGYTTKDMPCTLTLQFLVRNSQLNMVVNMRSNDLWFGGVYDIFCFTALQELMANALQLPVGVYYHHVGSFHLYEKNLKDIQDCIDAYDAEILKASVPPRIRPDQTMQELLQLERTIRTGTANNSLEALCAHLEDWPMQPTLWTLGVAAWRWKKINNSTEIKEEQRRYVRSLLQDRLGLMFDRCFF